ncbi:hypothetical protein MAPG_01891 [Magnaporthiopsis poae ATCC 64411]|uniref:ABC transmembrane type-1 domain-containing protein n=1 Tax=Magnaporthiopsis poae (strain ATCC 64411 / 73-15) TaxID=644358 RepID=A0A0C4DPW2_MAGP6|nr:hypothetical protein MAPG_01891 [Magnaporthiopsis poae ATCC 64411]
MSSADGAAAGADAAAEPKGRFGLSVKTLLTLRNFTKIFNYATLLDRVVLGVSSVAAVATGLTIPLMVIVFANLIGVFTDFYRQGSTTTGAEFSRSVNQCVFYIIYLFVARLAASYIMNLGFRVTSLRISSAIRVVYLRSLFALPISTLDAIPAGQTAAIVTVTAGLLQKSGSNNKGVVQVFFGVYGTFALAFWFAFRMYAVVVVTTPQDLIVVLLCVMMMATSIGQISAPLAAAHQAAEACAIFHTIIDAPKPVCGGARGDDEVRADGDIALINVNFAYPTRPEVRVLDQLSLTFPAGKVTAIVGPSGSGKSTIVGILERWYEFDGDPATNPITLFLRNGFVTVSGRLLTEIDVKWWRNQIGLVQQDNVLFNTTIYKNVENGLIGTKWEHESDEKKALLIEAACKDAFADEFIARLPDVRLPNNRRRVRHQAKRRPATKASYRARHREAAQDPDPGRGDVGHRRAQRADRAGGPGARQHRPHDHRHCAPAGNHQAGRQDCCFAPRPRRAAGHARRAARPARQHVLPPRQRPSHRCVRSQPCTGSSSAGGGGGGGGGGGS